MNFNRSFDLSYKDLTIDFSEICWWHFGGCKFDPIISQLELEIINYFY